MSFKNDQNKANSQATEVAKVPKYGEIKIDEARSILEQLRSKTHEKITAIKTETDDTENRRRIEEEKKKKERANQIQNEVITSHKKNVEIDWNWQELEEKEDCKELSSEIDKQVIECQKIINDKENLKKEFETALHAKDKHYVIAMQLMNENIDDLITKMKDQFDKMRKSYASQLQSIESEFDRERSDLLKNNEVEIQKLFGRHQQVEEDYLKRKTDQEQTQSQDLENQKSSDANNQAEQKIKLEKEMQILEKCMEDMKAVYRLNEEKLDFNTRVLDERSQVNKKSELMLKKRKTRYEGIVRTVVIDYKYELAKFQKDNLGHTNDFKRFTKSFKELQMKFERFEKSDKDRLKNVWVMNQQEAQDIVKKIIDADKVIHTQQLDIPWTPPKDDIFKNILSTEDQTSPESYQGAESQAQQSQIGAGNTQSRSDLVQDMSQHTSDNQTNAADNFIKYEKIKNVFKMFIDHAEYLIDDRAFERCETASVKEQFSIKIDSIRKSIGVDSMEDVNLLVTVFYEFEANYQKEIQTKFDEEMKALDDAAIEGGNQPPAATQDMRRQSQEEMEEAKAEQERNPARLALDPDHIVLALQKYHEEREKELIQQSIKGQAPKKKQTAVSTEEEAEREKKKQKMFWEKLITVLSPQKQSVWRSLDKTLSQYYEMLVKRQNLIEETGLLNQQNEELKTLLNQYLQAGVNQELQVPPTQVIRLDI